MHVALVDLRWDGHHTPYVVYLSRYFTDEGHEVTFITHAENPRLDELPESENLTIRAADIPRFSDDVPGGLLASVTEQGYRTRQLLEIYRIACEAGVEVVHLLYFDRTQIPLYIAEKLSSDDFPPTVATLHRDAFLDNNDRPLPKLVTQAATKWALHSTLRDGTLDCLTVHANSIQDRIIGAVPAATRANTRTIPAPTPEPSIDVSQREAREYLDLPTNEPLFLFFGGLRYEKGPDILAKALQDVEQEITVVFAGSQVDFTQADVDRWKRQVPEYVTIVDRIEFIPEADVDYYFTAADALVLPYRRIRGISGPLRRAAMVGTPIIAPENSDIGSIVVQHDLGRCIENPLGTGLSGWFNCYDGNLAITPQRALSCFAESRHWMATGYLLMEIFEESMK